MIDNLICSVAGLNKKKWEPSFVFKIRKSITLKRYKKPIPKKFSASALALKLEGKE